MKTILSCLGSVSLCVIMVIATHGPVRADWQPGIGDVMDLVYCVVGLSPCEGRQPGADTVTQLSCGVGTVLSEGGGQCVIPGVGSGEDPSEPPGPSASWSATISDVMNLIYCLVGAASCDGLEPGLDAVALVTCGVGTTLDPAGAACVPDPDVCWVPGEGGTGCDLCPVPCPPQPVSWAVPMTLDMGASLPGHQQGVTVGVPLPKGVLDVAPHCRLVREDGVVFPAQCETLLWWPMSDPPSIQWIRVSASVASAEALEIPLSLELFAQWPAVPPPVTHAGPPLEGDGLVLTNGVLSLTVGDFGEGVVVQGMLPDGQEGEGAVVRLTLTDDLGVLHHGQLTGPPVVLSSGPGVAMVRLDGDFVAADGSGAVFNGFEVALSLYDGVDHLVVDHTLVVTSPEMQSRGIGSVQLRVEAGEPLETLYLDDDGLSPLAVVEGEGLAVVHTDLESAFVAHAGGTHAHAAVLGYLHGSGPTVGVGLAIREPHLEYPKRLELVHSDGAGDALVADLWPASHGDQDLLESYPAQSGPLDLRNDLMEAEGVFCVGDEALTLGLGLVEVAQTPCMPWHGEGAAAKAAVIAALATQPDWPLILSDFIGPKEAFDEFLTACDVVCLGRRLIFDSRGTYNETAQGLSKTHRLALHVGGPTAAAAARSRQLAEALDAEPFLRLAPEVFADSGALGAYAPADPDLFPEVESAFAGLLAEALASEDSHHMYGMLRYGNELNLHGWVKDLTTLLGPGYEVLPYIGFFNQEAHDILASQLWFYLRLGTRESWRYLQRRARTARDVVTVWHHEVPEYVGLQRRHSMYPWSNISTSHSVMRGMHTYHLLTGDRRARRAVVRAGDAMLLDYWSEWSLFGKYNTLSPSWSGSIGTTLRGHTAPWLNLMLAHQHQPDGAYAGAIDGFKETLLSLQLDTGTFPSTIYVADSGEPAGSSAVGYDHSLMHALEVHHAIFGDAETLGAIVDLAQASVLADGQGSLEYSQSPYYAVEALAYFADGFDALYLVLFEILRWEAAQADSYGSVWRYHVPRGVGPYVEAARHFFDEVGGEVTEIWGGYHERLLAQTPAPGNVFGVRSETWDVALALVEPSDRHFELTYDARYISKYSGVNSRFELLDPDDQPIFCRQYYTCAGEASAPCVIASACPEVEPGRVISDCELSEPVLTGDDHWPGDACTLRVQPDGLSGEYQILLRPPEEAVDPQPGSPSLKSNIRWALTNHMAWPDQGLIGGLRTALSNIPLRFYLLAVDVLMGGTSEGVDLMFGSPNRLSGMGWLTPDGAVGGSAYLFKEEMGWHAEPTVQTLSVPGAAAADHIPLRLDTGISFGDSRKRQFELAVAPDVSREIWVDASPVLEQIPLVNADFELTSVAEGEVVLGEGWTVVEDYLPGAWLTSVDPTAALEGDVSHLLTEPFIYIYQSLLGTVEMGARYLVRFLAHANEPSGCMVQAAFSFKGEDGAFQWDHSLKVTKNVTPSDAPGIQSMEFTIAPVGALPGEVLELGNANLRVRSYNVATDTLHCLVDAIELYRISGPE